MQTTGICQAGAPGTFCDDCAGTASGSNEFNDMQMYVVTHFDKVVMVGSAIDLPVPSVAVIAGLQRPHARGRVSLRSADPQRARGDRP